MESKEKYIHIIKLLDKEDRRVLFDSLFKFMKEDKKQTALIMGVTQSAIDHAFDEETKKRYAPKPETAARIFAYLVKVAASMDNSKNEEVLVSLKYQPERRLNKEVLDAVTHYKSIKAKEDPAFTAVWEKITQKLKTEQEIINNSLSKIVDISLRSDLTVQEEKLLQETILEVEQLKMVRKNIKKLCAEKAITFSQTFNDPDFLEFIIKFREDVLLKLLTNVATHRGKMSVEQVKSMCPVWGISIPQ